MKIEPGTSMRKKTLTRFIINNLLVACSMFAIISGLVLQIEFHMGSHPDNHITFQQPPTYEQIQGFDLNKTVFEFNYYGWSVIHKISIVFFLILMTYHIYIHWKWFKEVTSKNLFRKNKQVITFSGFFILVAITGSGSWLIDIISNNSILRIILIEIHDKLTLIFIIYLILHIAKRNKWFMKTYAKLKSQYLH